MKKFISSRRKAITLGVSLLLLATAGIAVAIDIYTYRCPRCNAIYQFSQPNGFAKCSQDGSMLVRQ